MSATVETIIHCDGGKECKHDGSYGDGDGRWMSAKQQRAGYAKSGWVYKNGKDYCEDCAKRLGFKNNDIS